MFSVPIPVILATKSPPHVCAHACISKHPVRWRSDLVQRLSISTVKANAPLMDYTALQPDLMVTLWSFHQFLLSSLFLPATMMLSEWANESGPETCAIFSTYLVHGSLFTAPLSAPSLYLHIIFLQLLYLKLQASPTTASRLLFLLSFHSIYCHLTFPHIELIILYIVYVPQDIRMNCVIHK